jgi:hypothetical protein
MPAGNHDKPPRERGSERVGGTPPQAEVHPFARGRVWIGVFGAAQAFIVGRHGPIISTYGYNRALAGSLIARDGTIPCLPVDMY